MKDLEKLGAELNKSGKGEKLKSIADSAEGKAISRMVDSARVEQAAKSGDTAALRDILSQVLSTDEGKRLAEKLKKAME
ncbi:MAG: hypothetical protein PUC58_01410 [Oscillospiraceae bacterium]|nr:hypothetical protein [Oscillospiraceae bacterium]